MDKCGTIERPHRLFRQLLQFAVGEEALLHGGSVTSLAVEGGGVGGGGVLEVVGVGAVGPVGGEGEITAKLFTHGNVGG